MTPPTLHPRSRPFGAPPNRRAFLAFALPVLPGCETLGLIDSGTQLAFLLERSARELVASGAASMTVHYTPLGRPDQAFEIHVTRSRQEQAPYGGFLSVTGEVPGSTTHHGPYIFVPRALSRRIERGSATLTLERQGTRVALLAIT